MAETDHPLDDDAGTALQLAASSSFASTSEAKFIEPWLRRVRDVDDDTLAGLMQQLLALRRMRNVVATICCGVGIAAFGALHTSGLYLLLIYAVLAFAVGMPVFAIGSLSVRRLFLREAGQQGLSKAASMLVLTRAERRARWLSPASSTETKIDELMKAVRDPDTAS
ncbi:MAG TPA: hypothetical protein VGF99_03790 [Myxococcota bacterium]